MPSLDFNSCLACRRFDVVLHDATHPVRLFALHFRASEDVVTVLGIGGLLSPSQQFIKESALSKLPVVTTLGSSSCFAGATKASADFELLCNAATATAANVLF